MIHVIIEIHSFKGLPRDGVQLFTSDHNLLQLGSEGAEQLVGQDAGVLHYRGRQPFQRGQPRDDRAKAELEFLYFWPTLKINCLWFISNMRDTSKFN